MSSSPVSSAWKATAPHLQSLLRVIAAFLFMQVGSMKLFGFPMAMPPGMVLRPYSQMWFAGVLEVFGGGLILIGLFTRPIAFLLAGEMAVAYFQAHAPHGFWPLVNGGTDAVLFCFIWLYFSAAGPGPWSVDAILSRNGQSQRS